MIYSTSLSVRCWNWLLNTSKKLIYPQNHHFIKPTHIFPPHKYCISQTPASRCVKVQLKSHLHIPFHRPNKCQDGFLNVLSLVLYYKRKSRGLWGTIRHACFHPSVVESDWQQLADDQRLSVAPKRARGEVINRVLQLHVMGRQWCRDRRRPKWKSQIHLSFTLFNVLQLIS